MRCKYEWMIQVISVITFIRGRLKQRIIYKIIILFSEVFQGWRLSSIITFFLSLFPIISGRRYRQNFGCGNCKTEKGPRETLHKAEYFFRNAWSFNVRRG